MKRQPKRDVERVASPAEFVARLRGLADALETGRTFSFPVAGGRVAVPAVVIFSIGHERDGEGEVLDFQLKWKRPPKPRP